MDSEGYSSFNVVLVLSFKNTFSLPFPLMITAAWLRTGTQLIFFVCCLSSLMTPLSVPHSYSSALLTVSPDDQQVPLENTECRKQSLRAAKWLLTPSRVSGWRCSETGRLADWQTCVTMAAEVRTLVSTNLHSVTLSIKRDFKWIFLIHPMMYDLSNVPFLHHFAFMAGLGIEVIGQ